MEVLEVDTREGYNLWSSSYDSTGNPLVALEDLAFNQMLGPVSGLKVVDLGSGTGRNAIKLYDRGAEVTGVDFLEGMLTKARVISGNRQITYHQCDLNETLPFSDNSFDLVISSLVIEHIENLVLAFLEMGRICKRSG